MSPGLLKVGVEVVEPLYPGKQRGVIEDYNMTETAKYNAVKPVYQVGLTLGVGLER